MNSVTNEIHAVARLVPGKYDSRAFRKDVDGVVSQLAAEGLDLASKETYHAAIDQVARRYDMSGEALSKMAHITDFMKQRSQDALKYIKAVMDEEAQPCLPGMENVMRVPRQLLIGDEVVDIGDPRLTLQVYLDQLNQSKGITMKELEAFTRKTHEIQEFAEFLDREIATAEEAINEAVSLYGVPPSDLIYDKKKKVWGPHPRAAHRARPID